MATKGKRHITPIRLMNTKRRTIPNLFYANQHRIPQPAGPTDPDPDPSIVLPCADTKEIILSHYFESSVHYDLRALEHVS